MTVLEAHQIIQQELQSLNSFENMDMQYPEVDRALNTCMFDMIDDYCTQFDELRHDKKFEQIQALLDKLDRLYVVDKELTPTLVSNAPAPYYYYDITSIAAPNVVYRILDDKSKVTITCGKTTKSKVVSNILTKSYNLTRTLENSLTKTRKDAPISHYENGKLRVFYDGFTVDKIYIDYIKSPLKIHYKLPFLGVSNGATNSVIGFLQQSFNPLEHLYIGMPIYESGVFKGNITDITSSTITIDATLSATTHNLVAGFNGDSLMPLSDSGNKELVKRTSLYLMKLSEQSQQKIVNLTAENQ